MSSIRNATSGFRRTLVTATLAAALPAIAGCNLKYKRPVEAANDDIVQDQAMQVRQWPEQEALFANSSLEAFRNRFPYNYETTRSQRKQLGYVASPLAFVVQSIVFPFTFIKNPPGTKQTFRTVSYEPTHTAMPDRPELIEGISRMPRGGLDTPSAAEPSPTPSPTPAPGPTPAPAPTPTPARPPTPAPAPSPAPAPTPAPAPKPAPTPKPPPRPNLAPAPAPAPTPSPLNK